MSKVLREFDYSFNGVTALKAKIGASIDFGAMTAGLEAEGYIEPEAETPVLVEPVTEPEVTPEPEPEVETAPEPTIEPEAETPVLEAKTSRKRK